MKLYVNTIKRYTQVEKQKQEGFCRQEPVR